MITEIILIVFAIIYYLFSTFLFATVIQDTNKRYNYLQVVGIVLMLMIIAPMATPIILGIKIGTWINND